MEFWRSPLAGSKPQSMGAQYLFIPQANHPQHPKCKGDRFWGIILAYPGLVSTGWEDVLGCQHKFNAIICRWMVLHIHEGCTTAHGSASCWGCSSMMKEQSKMEQRQQRAVSDVSLWVLAFCVVQYPGTTAGAGIEARERPQVNQPGINMDQLD